MQKYLILACLLLSLGFANLKDFIDFDEYLIEILPPAKQEFAGVVVELSSSTSNSGFSFMVEVTNRSDNKFSLNFDEDILLAECRPLVEHGAERFYSVLPNETQRISFIFPRERISAEKELILRIKEYKYLVKVHVVSNELKALDPKRTSFYIYNSQSQLLSVQTVLSGDILIANNSDKNIQKLRALSEDQMAEFTQIDHKHWFLQRAERFLVSGNSLIAIKENERSNYFIFDVNKINSVDAREPVKMIDPINYMIQIVPGSVQKGETVVLRVITKNKLAPYRITAMINHKAYALSYQKNNIWECSFFVPGSFSIGDYPVEFYIKEENALGIATEYFRVL